MLFLLLDALGGEYMKIYTVISMFIVLVVYEYFSFSVGKPLILPSGESILMEIFTIIRGTTFIEIISVTVVVF